MSRTLTGCHRYSPKQAKVAKLAKRTGESRPHRRPPQRHLYFLPEPQGQIRPDSPRLPTEPLLNVRRTPLLQCPQLGVGRLVPRQHQRPILGHISEKGTAGSCDRRNEPVDVPKSCFVASGARAAGNLNLDPASLRKPLGRVCPWAPNYEGNRIKLVTQHRFRPGAPKWMKVERECSG